MNSNSNDWIWITLLVACVALIVLAVFVENEYDKDQWAEFMVKNNCKVVQHVRGGVVVGTGIGVMQNGQIGMVTTTHTTPEKTAWSCDDGVTYWR